MRKQLIVKLHHASLIVQDLKKSLVFYQQVLGLDLDDSRPDLGYPGVWLSLPGQQQLHLMEIDNPDKNSKRPDHGGRDHHIAFSVCSITDVAELLDSLEMTYSKSKSGRKAIFCRDPDGNALEFIES